MTPSVDDGGGPLPSDGEERKFFWNNDGEKGKFFWNEKQVVLERKALSVLVWVLLSLVVRWGCGGGVLLGGFAMFNNWEETGTLPEHMGLAQDL